MGKRRSTIEFSENVAPLLEHWEALGYDIRDIVGAAIVIFHNSTAQQREQAMAQANAASIIQPFTDDQIEKLWTEVEKIAKTVGVKVNKPKRKRD